MITAQAAGNLQSIRRDIARTVMGIIFFITVLLATLLLGSDGLQITPEVIVAVVVAYIATTILPTAGPPQPVTPVEPVEPAAPAASPVTRSG